MNKLIAATTTVAATGLLLAGSLGTASAQTRTRTIEGKLVEAPVATEYDWAAGYISLDQDYDRAGQRIGADVTTCHAATTTATSATCYAAIALKKGLVTIAFTETRSAATIHGKVIGGAGRYQHATGTINIIETGNDSGPSTATWTLTLHY